MTNAVEPRLGDVLDWRVTPWLYRKWFGWPMFRRWKRFYHWGGHPDGDWEMEYAEWPGPENPDYEL